MNDRIHLCNCMTAGRVFRVYFSASGQLTTFEDAQTGEVVQRGTTGTVEEARQLANLIVRQNLGRADSIGV